MGPLVLLCFAPTPSPRGRLWPALVALALALAIPASAQAHGTPAAQAIDEATLRAEETALLGPEHAAEHALLRRYERSPRWRKSARKAERTARALARSAVAGERRDRVGRWKGYFDLPPGVFAINAAMLPTGKVLWFSYPNSPDYGPGVQHGGRAYLWDPRKGTGARAFKAVPPPIDPARGLPVNLFCAGISFLADGRVLVTGGNLRYPAETPAGKYAGLDDVYTFDPLTERWTQQPDMNHGRWYPSQLLMPDGRTFIMGGLDEFGLGIKNEDLELFTPAAARNGVGKVGLLGPEGLLGDPGMPPVGDYYPHLFWMPSGRGLVAGPYTTDSWWFAPPGNPPTFRWTDIPQFNTSRVWGSAVLVPAGPGGSHQVLQLGGSDKPASDDAHTDALATPSATLFDERTGVWKERPPGATDALRVPRSHLNTVLLPDGTMVTVGGGDGAEAGGGAANGGPGQYAASDPNQLRVELWNPVTRTWRLGPPQREFRTYHSTAMLMPDARVVSAGDDWNSRYAGADKFTRDSAEIYEPPYLFDGNALAPRPKIAAAPSSISWGRPYRLRVKRAARRAVKHAVLVAPSATTHAVDGNQRVVPLRVTGSNARSLTVRAPARKNIAPPGRYMLFVLDAKGTPSKARWVALRAPRRLH
jgi:hypothetical protein